MSFSSAEFKTVAEMLSVCEQKFGEITEMNCDTVHEYGCSGCTGGCEGKGASIWFMPEN